MFKVFILVSMLVFQAWSQNGPKINQSTLEAGYIPNGFDSNDQVQMVIEGTYRDTCSKPAGTRFSVNAASKTIQILSYEYRYSGVCLDMLVPHDEVVNLGIVGSGSYQVVQANGRQLGRLNVNMATKASPDDFLYAPISQAYIKNVGGRQALTLSGVFTSSCMRLKNVVSHVEGNVVTVQPLAELLPTATHCIQGRFPFEQTTYLQAVRPGRYLLHVRSLNGNAINNLFDLR